jgi:hypothetical protein
LFNYDKKYTADPSILRNPIPKLRYSKKLTKFIKYNANNNMVSEKYITLKIVHTTLTQYCVGGKMEKNEMGGACGAYGGGERCAQGSGGET